MAKRRPSGDGMVRRRADGRWEGRIVVGHKENGNPIFRTIFATTQKELLEKLHHDLTVYEGIELNENSRMSLGDWLDRWLEEYAANAVRESTLRGYRRYINMIKPSLGSKMISKVTQDDVQTLYNFLKEHGRVKEHPQMGHQLSSATIRSLHGVLYGAMEAAKAAHIIAINPTEGVTLPKWERAEMQILNEEQLEVFMAEIEKDPLWYDLFYTEITTGLRRGELCGLMWSDFNAAQGTLQIRRTLQYNKGIGYVAGETKTEAGKRTITLSPSTAALLAERKKSACSFWIFPDLFSPEKPMNPTRAYNKLSVILADAGLPHLRFHDLRHTFATHALAGGVDVKTLANMLGHTKPSFTLDTYTHVTTDMQKQAASIVDDFMTDILGEELRPWESKENAGTFASAACGG